MKVSREHPLAATTRANSSSALRRIAQSLRGEMLAELGLAPGAIQHLSLELAAGRIDVVAPGATHRRDHAGGAGRLLDGADSVPAGATGAGVGDRVDGEAGE